MAEQYYRFNIDIAIPVSVYDKSALSEDNGISTFLNAISTLQSIAAKMNAGTVKEENTVSAKWHLCNHEFGLPCEPEQDIKLDSKITTAKSIEEK